MKKMGHGKYAKYFQGNNILPIPEFVETIEPKTISGDFWSLN